MNYRVEVWKNRRWMVVETCMLLKEAIEEAYLCKKAGKGALVKHEHAPCIAAAQDTILFVIERMNK